MNRITVLQRRAAKRKSVAAAHAAARNKVSNDFRMWAALPAFVAGVIVAGPNDTLPISTVFRPDFRKGICQTCGCSETDPCVDSFGECCAWVNSTQTRCTFCGPKKITAAQPSNPSGRLAILTIQQMHRRLGDTLAQISGYSRAEQPAEPKGTNNDN